MYEEEGANYKSDKTKPRVVVPEGREVELVCLIDDEFVKDCNIHDDSSFVIGDFPKTDLPYFTKFIEPKEVWLWGNELHIIFRYADDPPNFPKIQRYLKEIGADE